MADKTIHPAIQEELEMLYARFQGKQELTLDDYADYFNIDRHYASQHFYRINLSKTKIEHKRIGKLILIPILDFAIWLAMYKVVNGKKLILPSAAETKAAMNNRMGFSASPKCDYHIQEELDMLHVRFPGIQELTLDDYADYFGIDRHYASQHFYRINKGKVKIDHKRIGKLIIIPMIDFAYWLTRCKVVSGKALILPTIADTKAAMTARRGFSSTPKWDYRTLS